MTIFEDELAKRNRQTQLAGGQGINTSGIVGGIGGNSLAQPTAAAPASSGFQNLNAYLDMNKGAGAGIASDLNKNLVSDVEKYKTGATDQTKTFGDSVTAANSALDTQVSGIKDKLTEDASANAAGAKGFLGSTYKGPTADSTIASLADSQKEINGRLGKVDDWDSMNANAQKNYGYSKGFGALDSFLMQGDEAGRKELADIKGKSTDINSAYDTAKTGLTNSQASGTKAFTDAQDSIKKHASAVRGNIEKDASTRAQGYGAENTGNEGYQAAGLGDMLDQGNLDDLAALNDLTGDAAGNYVKSYNAGQAKQEPVVQNPVVQQPEVSRPNVMDPAQEAINKITPNEDLVVASNRATAPTQNTFYDNPLTKIAAGKQSVGGALSDMSGIDQNRFSLGLNPLGSGQPIKAPKINTNRLKIKKPKW